MSTTTAARRARSQIRAHPDIFVAAKAALAAVLAWLLVQPFGGFVQEYPYYAPLGAITVVSASVAVSVRSSVRIVAAIVLGSVVALAAELLPLPGPVPLGLAIIIASLLGATGIVGAMGSWIPLAALFVLLAGANDPLDYTAAYGGLTALGAVVGVGVNLLFPQLPLTPAALAQDRLRGQLADQLDELGTALEQELVDDKDWTALRDSLDRTARDAQTLMAQAHDARRANWKARHWSETADQQGRRERALQRLTRCVDDVIALVSDQRIEIRRDDPSAAELRATAAEALRAVAALLRDPAATDRARSAVADLRSEVVRAQTDTGDHHFAAAAITLNLEQATEAWT